MALPAPRTTRSTPKVVSWSYSKLKNWRSCPKKHYHVDIKKEHTEEDNEHIMYGNAVHKMLAERISNGTPIPEFHRAKLEPWAAKVLTGHADANAFTAATGGFLKTEQQLAITEDFQPCEWFDRQVPVWHRSIMDVLKVVGPVALGIDWKTGKIIEDSEQLLIAAQCVFAHYPQVQRIRVMFAWLKEDADTTVDVGRADMGDLWANLLPEVRQYQEAVRTTTFPPRPSGLCKRYCPVTSCPHCGEGR